MPLSASSGIRHRFQCLFLPSGRVPHVLLTLSPLSPRRGSVRLACLIHAASVHSEPGSNSPLLKNLTCDYTGSTCIFKLDVFFLFRGPPPSRGGRPHIKLHCSVSKELLFRPPGFSGVRLTISPISDFASRFHDFFDIFFGRGAANPPENFTSPRT